MARGIVNQFHRQYYRRFQGDIGATHWMGTTVNKVPTDLWVYQEILSEIQPEVVVETGTAQGGSALYLANLCDLMGRGRVISVDVLANDQRPQHPRVTYLTGSSTDLEMVAQVRGMVGDEAPVIVILDSDHSERHVRDELLQPERLPAAGSLGPAGCTKAWRSRNALDNDEDLLGSRSSSLTRAPERRRSWCGFPARSNSRPSAYASDGRTAIGDCGRLTIGQ